MLRKKLLSIIIKLPDRIPLVVLSLSWTVLLLFILGRKLNEPYNVSCHVEVTEDQEFKRQWLRMLRARVDWKAILAPCLGNTEWNKTNPGWGKANETSAEKSFIDFMDIRPAGQFSRIFIQTRTKDGKNKTIGGDFWKVTMSGPARITATIFDHGNGTYEALVLFLDPGTYNVDVFLERSLCQGFKDPPQNWFRRGIEFEPNQPKNIFGRLNDSVFAPLQVGRNITIEILPSDDVHRGLRASSKMSCPESCRLIWNGYGRWIGDNWIPFLRSENHDLQAALQNRMNKTKGSLYLVGDSITQHFGMEYFKRHEVCNVLFASCVWLVLKRYPLWEHQNLSKLHSSDDFQPKIVLDSISNILRKPEMKNSSSLLLVNFAVHYAQCVNFTTYQHLIDDFVSLIQDRQKLFGSEARVIWKTTTHPHFHEVFPAHYGRFLTSSRVGLYAAYAMSAMCKAGIEILDVRPTSSSTLKGRKDNFHYHEKVFTKSMDALTWYSIRDPETRSRDACLGT